LLADANGLPVKVIINRQQARATEVKTFNCKVKAVLLHASESWSLYNYRKDVRHVASLHQQMPTKYRKCTLASENIQQ